MAGLREQFAAALRAAREAREMSQAELSERAALSVEAYGRLERGRVLPRAETLVRLAEALRVPTDRLLGVRGADEGTMLALLQQADSEEQRFLLVVLRELQRFRRRR
jgi:transcriptional regulator with XRE-family HTH domain